MRIIALLLTLMFTAVPVYAEITDITGPCSAIKAKPVTSLPAGNYRMTSREGTERVRISHLGNGVYVLANGKQQTEVTVLLNTRGRKGNTYIVRGKAKAGGCIFSIGVPAKGNVLRVYQAYRASLGVYPQPVETLSVKQRTTNARMFQRFAAHTSPQGLLLTIRPAN